MTAVKTDLPAKRESALPAETGPVDITRLMVIALQTGKADEMERLVALHNRQEDRRAAQEFAAAMANFQLHCPSIKRTSTAKIATSSGREFSYKYAELDEIAKTIGPPLHSAGLSYTWDSTVGEGKLRCTCTLRHANGHSIVASFEVPVDSKAGMSEQQKYAAALTFARRQSLVSVLGLTATDPDSDAAPGASEPISASQAADLAALVDEVGADMKRFLSFMGVTKLAEITVAALPRAIKALEDKRKGAK